jgi:anti-anti-sigma factor
MENVIKLEKIETVTLFDIQGDVTIASENFLNEAYKSASDQDATKILLRFQTDAYINSGGIALLIQLLAQTKKNGQTVAITGLSDHFKKIFGMVGITKFAKIYSSVDEAVAALS